MQMALSYKMFFLYWGRGLLIAAVIAAIAGLLAGEGDRVLFLYQAAVILFVISVLFLVAGRKIRPPND